MSIVKYHESHYVAVLDRYDLRTLSRMTFKERTQCICPRRSNVRKASKFFFLFIFFCVKSCETGPPVLSSLSEKTRNSNNCRYNYKGSTFSSVILRPWVLLVRPESNSRPPVWQPDAQATEPPLRGSGNHVLINQLDDWSARMLRKLTRVNALNFRNKVLWKNTKYLIPQTHGWKIYYEIAR